MKLVIAGVPNFCGRGQDAPICAQQWLAALGPTIALLLAGYGALQVRKQIEHGQVAVKAAERDMLRHEFEVLSRLRMEVTDQQRELEKYDGVFMRGFGIPDGTQWIDLEKLQYIFDGFVEWIADVKREPYLFQFRDQFNVVFRRAFRRSEFYRRSAYRWDTSKMSRRQMIIALDFVRRNSYRVMADVRNVIDQQIVGISARMLQLTDGRAKRVFASAQ